MSAEGLEERAEIDDADVRSVAYIRDLLRESLDRLEALYDGAASSSGVTTGYPSLDSLLGSIEPDELVVIGSRPSMGKTALALGIASYVATDLHKPVLIFSIESSHREVTTRLLCAQGRINSARMRSGQLEDADWGKVSQAIGRLAEAPVYIDDSARLTLDDVKRKALRLRDNDGLGLIIVDYLQLLSLGQPQQPRAAIVEDPARELKLLARELGVPILLLSQVSRNVEVRSDKRPLLADLRDHGELEEHADVIMFLYRDDMYHFGSTEQGIAEVIVAKHRGGPTGTCHLAFLPDFGAFLNIALADGVLADDADLALTATETE